MKKNIIQVLLLVLIAGCSGRDDLSDAYGNFETIEYLISAEGSGKILGLDLDEGDILSAGQVVGLIDTIPLHLQAEHRRMPLLHVLQNQGQKQHRKHPG